MTIGAVPPRNGAIHAAAGGTKVAPANAPMGRGFADALRGIALSDERDQIADATPQDHAARFNQHGFFAHADAIDAPTLAVTAPPLPDGVLPSGADGIAMTPPLSALPLQTDTPDPADAAPVAQAGRGVGEVTATAAAGHATAIRPSATPVQGMAPPPAAFAPMLPTDGASIVPARAGRVRPTQDAGAKTAIAVTLDAGDGTAAVTVSAHGMPDGEVDTLHTDIVALLRRHGRAIGDIRLNGRPMGQGRDRSGT